MTRAAFYAQRGFTSRALDVHAHAHGQRATYRLGCRCDACRVANTRYEIERAQARKNGEWNGLVSAAEARAHILKLRKQGVGRRAIGAASDVGDTTLQDIIAGRKTQIRALTARRILAVTRDMASDHALIPAAATWRRIRVLVDEGFTHRRIAELLGFRNGGLQFGRDHITVRNAARVERLYRRYMA